MGRKLTPEQVCQIPEMIEDGFTAQEIADIFEITVYGIRSTIRVKAWERYAFTDEIPGRPTRCPDCGGMVVDDTKPCLVCKVERDRRAKVVFQKLGNSS